MIESEAEAESMESEEPLTLREKLYDLADEVMHELIFGAEDGLVSILGAVTGVAISVQDTRLVLLAGASAAIPGAISMAAGTYLGSKSEREVLDRLLAEERQEFVEDPEGEYREMAEYYQARGFSPEEAAILLKRLKRNSAFLMEEMSLHELGIARGQLVHPLRRAVWIFITYLLATAFPVLPYAWLDRRSALVVSVAGTMLALFGVGAAKTLVTGRNVWRSAFEMLFIAALAGFTGFLVGQAFSWLSGGGLGR